MQIYTAERRPKPNQLTMSEGPAASTLRLRVCEAGASWQRMDSSIAQTLPLASGTNESPVNACQWLQAQVTPHSSMCQLVVAGRRQSDSRTDCCSVGHQPNTCTTAAAS